MIRFCLLLSLLLGVVPGLIGTARAQPNLTVDTLEARLLYPTTPDSQRVVLCVELSHRMPTPAQALRYSQRAVEFARGQRPIFELRALDNLFVAYSRAGQEKPALRTAQKLLHQARRAGNARYQAFANLDMAGIMDRGRNKAQAEHYYRQAVAVAEAGHVPPVQQAEIGLEWGVFLEDVGRYAEARAVINGILRALDTPPETPERPFQRARCLAVLGDVALAEKKFAEAGGFARRGLALIGGATTELPPFQWDLGATCYHILTSAALGTRDYVAAVGYGEQALHYARLVGVPAMEADILPQVIESRIRVADYPRASAFQERLLTLRDTLYSQGKAADLNRLQTEFETVQRQQAIRSLTQQTRIQRLEVEHQRNRGTALTLGVAGLLALLIGGGGLYWQLNRSRQRLAFSEAALRAADRTRTLLMSIIGHDLRSPVAGFQQVAPLLRHYADQPAPADQRALADELAADAGRLSGLLENLLHWGRLQTGHVPSAPERTAVGPLIDAAFRLHRATAAAKPVRLVVEVPDVLPPAWADPTLLATVLRNLIGNAVKFTPPGGTVTVSVAPAATFDHLRLSVRDTGVGIAPDRLAHLLRDPDDVRPGTGTAGESGTGLGLVVCRLFVQQLGSALHAESEPGAGTHFWFEAPVATGERETVLVADTVR